MKVSVDERWEGFVENAVRSGGFPSADAVVRAGLRLLEEKEAELRATIRSSLEEGGSFAEEDVREALEAKARELANQGY